MPSIPVKKLRPQAQLPTRGTPGAAGADLYACLASPIVVGPGETVFIPTGLAMEIPEGFGGFLYARSGLACKQDLAPANKVGVIDCDYRGEVTVALHNHGTQARTVCHGDRIAQLVIAPFLNAEFWETDSLSETNRGQGGFGSTGTR